MAPLPREVRDLIYECIVVDTPPNIQIAESRTQVPIVGASANLPLITLLPSFACVNKTLFAEIAPIVLRRKLLEITSALDIWYLEDLLEALPKASGWGKITNLSLFKLSSFSSSPARAAETMDTINSAYNLDTLIIGLSLADLYLPPDWPAPPSTTDDATNYMRNPVRKTSAEDLIGACMLYKLYGMSNLSRVIIKVEHGLFNHTPASISWLHELVERMMAGFEAVDGVDTQTSMEWTDDREPDMSIMRVAITRSVSKK
ncbi:hypothetical protein NX059_005816 [Plenodomus lindquistii]|nr:hypothetical protein NX059_005816 [Plenodomus lindquistii]